MKLAFFSCLALVLAGCEPPEPPAAPPSPPRTAAPPDPTLAIVAQMKAAEAAQATAAREGAAKLDADFQKAQGDAMAMAMAQEKAGDDALRRACGESRPARAAEARDYAMAMKRWTELTTKHKAWLDAHCTTQDTRGVHVAREGNGVTARDVGRPDAVSCKGGRPAGLTEEDVRMHLEGRGGESLAVTMSQAPTSSPDCRDHDAAAGLDLGVTLSDLAGLQKVIDWHAPTR